MTLANYINDLLYRYDCVIVPGFGGFITNKIGAKIDNNTNTFYAPTKQITFNSYLKHNDGLLANHIASSLGISFNDALKYINDEVVNWKSSLENSGVELEKIGFFSLTKENQLFFEPDVTANYLKSSFGLTSTRSISIERETQTPLHMVSIDVNDITNTEQETSLSRSIVPFILKYSAAAVLVLGIGSFWFTSYNNQQEERLLSEQQHTIEKQIQEATFIIDTPLTTVTVDVAEETQKNIHIIAGSFKDELNALKKVEQLKQKGYTAVIVGTNKWGLHQVAYQSFSSTAEAKDALKLIKATEAKDAWLLVK